MSCIAIMAPASTRANSQSRRSLGQMQAARARVIWWRSELSVF